MNPRSLKGVDYLRRSCPCAVLGLLLSACSDPRTDAASELLRLNEAMQRHATQYGRFPATLDPQQPVSATNLPHESEREVNLRLLGGSEDRYTATARAGIWICALNVQPGTKTSPDCTPAGNSPEPAPDSLGRPAPLLEHIGGAPSQP